MRKNRFESLESSPPFGFHIHKSFKAEASGTWFGRLVLLFKEATFDVSAIDLATKHTWQKAESNFRDL